MKIVLMATPEFAIPTLKKLLEDDFFEIVAVFTKEPKMAGRGQKLVKSPIHELAELHKIAIFTPKSLKNAQIQAIFHDFQADAAVVVAYGLILPKEILDATKFGCFNIHPSLLPKWRGPSPIQYNLLSNDKNCGVCVIKMDEGVDSGDIITKSEFIIKNDDNYHKLAEKFADLGANLMIEVLKKMPQVEFIKQNEKEASFSKKIEKNEAKIDWNKTAEEINRQIRALSGSLTAFFELNGEIFKVFGAQIVENDDFSLKIGEFDQNFVFQCGKNRLQPLMIQRQGKRAMKLEDFLRGFKI